MITNFKWGEISKMYNQKMYEPHLLGALYCYRVYNFHNKLVSMHIK